MWDPEFALEKEILTDPYKSIQIHTRFWDSASGRPRRGEDLSRPHVHRERRGRRAGERGQRRLRQRTGLQGVLRRRVSPQEIGG